jgi:phenylacetate-CoA ligase
MSLRYRIYRAGRRLVTFRQWEQYYDEIVKKGGGLTGEYLSALLEHAGERVPHYARLLSETDGGIDNFQQLPILTKECISANFDDLKSDQLNQNKWYLNSSGGSTGRPQTFIQDKVFQQWSLATQTYYYRQFLQMDYPQVPKVVLWGSERDLFNWSAGLKPKLSNWLTQTTFLNSFKITPETMLDYIRVINAKKPEFVKGYASSLYELAVAARNSNIRVNPPRVVYSSAETMTPFMRDVIEDVFQCTVYDFYGSREVGAIAGECRSGKMHIFEFNNLVEIVDANGKAAQPGEEGHIIITTLHNHSMPLIRYDIGDTAVAGMTCDCGNALPTLERVTGRVSDHFLTPTGDIVHGEYFTHLFYFRDWVEEFQVLQTEVDRIEVYYVSTKDSDPDDVADINAKIRLVMGETCAVEWIKVDEVPRTPQGKMLYTRSLLTQGEHR